MSEFYKNIHKKPSLIAGPCVWEGYSHAEAIAEKIKSVAAKYQVKFDKATYADRKEPFEDIKNLFEGKN